jgi:DNA-binding NtrC family response regulator
MKAGAYDFYEFPINMRLLMTMVGKAIEKQSLFFEKEKFKEKVEEQFDVSNIIGRSKSMQNVINIVRSVAQKNVNVLITGETGTGKEMIAEAIHYNSDRYEKPFVAVNCGAFNEGVLESELYGHEKGAFTGAISSRIGRFELADGGTIFLDEIGDISHSTQIKLLRVLQEKTFERVGGNEKFQTDARVIAATNRDLKTLIEKKQFRDDLYYRLNVVHIHIPPLKERREDIPLLVSHFINKLNEEKEYGIKGISNGAMQLLRDYSWPGNVRELENAVESAMALAQTDVIEEKYLPSFLLITPADEKSFYRIPSDMTMKEIEGEIIKRTVERASGNKTRAAQMLGIGLRTLQRKTKEMGL